ncbi:hypothetical protein C7N43_20510 [Sphingobacteriales bacterium UPWRP_1]|nr:hypothetical protein BVG80_02080 [Sphingobacteriales bacterium TSM_CSM]PSJ75149.1 hypothetical protein C7N43_20510 [Sphingobacteriales bacterium UPWRP_1]
MKTRCIYPAYCLLMVVFALTQPCFAQLYFDDGRVICCGTAIATTSDASIINPAGLGMVEKETRSFGLLQFSFNSYSNALPKKEIFKSMFSQQNISETAMEHIDNNTQQGQPFKLNGDVQMNWISGSWASPKYGGFSLQVADKITGRFNLQPDMTETLLNTGQPGAENQQDLLYNSNGVASESQSQLFYTHTRHAGISYGRSAFETDAVKVYAGLNFTYLWGIGHFNANIADSTATGNSAFANLYNINYGSLDSVLGNFAKDLFSSAGKGYSFSFGASVNIDRKLQAGIAILNLSRLTWDKQVLMAQNAPVDTLAEGIESYNFSDEAGHVYDMLGFEEGNRFVTQQNGKLHANLNYRLTRRLNLYADWILPLSEQSELYQPNTVSAGVNAQLVPDNGVNLSGGLLYNKTNGVRFPMGIAFRMGKKMFLSIATADFATLIAKNNPNPSLSVSLYRISL